MLERKVPGSYILIEQRLEALRATLPTLSLSDFKDAVLDPASLRRLKLRMSQASFEGSLAMTDFSELGIKGIIQLTGQNAAVCSIPPIFRRYHQRQAMQLA